MIQRQIDICKSLGFNALGGIYHQNGAVTGGQTSGHLIVEVHVARRVDQIENIFLSVFCLVDNADCLGLDGYAPLPLQIHVIQNLGLHFPLCQKSCLFNNPVRQGGFSMVYMCDDTKITDFTLVNSCHCLIPPIVFLYLFSKYKYGYFLILTL